MAIKGRSKDPEATKIVQDAMLCKIFGCLPSELDNEEFDKMMLYSIVYAEMAKKNPMFMLM